MSRILAAILIFSFPICAFAGFYPNKPHEHYADSTSRTVEKKPRRLFDYSDQWQLSVAPYIWFVSINGDATIKGNTSTVDTDIFDMFSDVKFAAEFHSEVWKGNWGFLIDPTYIKMAANESIGGGSIDTDMVYFLMDFAALYHFAHKDLPHNRTVDFSALAGGRLTHLDVDLDFNPGPAVGDSKTWISPFFGLRSIYGLSNNFSLVLQGDLGGFGIGSDLTWSASGLFAYHFSKRGALMFGYRALGDDYETGSGTSRFASDLVVRGPILGANIKLK